MSRAGLWLSILAAPMTFVFADNVTTDTSDYNLRTRAIAAGWDGVSPLRATTTVSSGIVVSATVNTNYAMDSGTTAFPSGSIWMVNNISGFIIGRGGNANSGSGGPAFRTIASLPVIFDNTSGTVGGGGGAGGVGQTSRVDIGYGKDAYSVGPSAGGTGGGGRTGRTNSSPNGTFAAPGGGYAGATNTNGSLYVTGGTGGTGGGWGSNGGGGNNSSYNAGSGSVTHLGGPGGGGAAGAAVVGNAYITWVNTGTRLGAIT